MVVCEEEKTKLYKNKDWLENKYINESLSSNQIGADRKVDPTTIQYWIKKNNISIRTLEEAKHVRSLRQVNHCTLSKKAIEWINGAVLGDGYLSSSSDYSACLYYGSKFFDYCKYISETLNSFRIKQCGNINEQYNKDWNCYAYQYVSLKYAELLPLRKHWYPAGKKIVPRDLKLTPLTCQQWYIGDGYLYPGKNNIRSHIVLSTCGFPVVDVEWLRIQLTKLGFKTTRQPSGNTLRISVHSTKEFLNYIGSCPIKDYQYKWYYNKEK